MGGLNFIFFIIFLARGCGEAVLWLVFVFWCVFWGFFEFYPPKKALNSVVSAHASVSSEYNTKCALTHYRARANEQNFLRCIHNY